MPEADFAHIILVCEDAKQARFARELIFALGLVSREKRRRIREVLCPPGAMSGEQFVREHYPLEVQAHRQRHALTALLVVTDADRFSVLERLNTFTLALQSAGLHPRQPHERIALLIPKWHIETWLRWLTTRQSTQEDKPYLKADYPLVLGRAAAQNMLALCPTPPADMLPSLNHGCQELTRLARPR